ncbi:MAG: hypothetical protein IID32_03305 [Planctomycetes bacterium]|nr:hypothetical protein [Planctomycetota bacterium]
MGCVLFVIAAALHSADKPIGGGDTWVAMACGRYTLGSWAVDHPDRTWQMKTLDNLGIHITKQDPFSPNSRSFIPGDHENFGWINQNWLTHILFYKMRDSWGEFSIVLYKFIQAILTALFAFWAARVLGAHPLLAAATAAFGTLLSRSFIDLRPNVSSILFAIIMILLYAYWKKNRPWALAWMIPLTIIWANVHGGFIYAIMVFFIFIVAHLVQFLFRSVWPDSFVRVSGKAFLLLLGAGAVITLVPAFFSPYGWENLVHPWIIAFSDEGKLWRNVIEWRPIWDDMGFGNRTPYLIFLSLFAVMFIVWWIMFFGKPKLPLLKKSRKLKSADRMPWPKIDLAQLGIIAVTILMSIKSRRFIFLGGVVLSPFLALMIQQIIDMVRLRKRHKLKLPMETPLSIFPNPKSLPAAVLALSAAVFMFAFFAVASHDIYFKPSHDGENYTLFRRMVGIQDQPVRAINFFDDNHVKGLVFNEWTNGGFVPFWQKPDPATGKPPCQVYIDGRAQAAYKLSHFKKSNKSRMPAPKPIKAYQNKVSQIAAQLNIQKNDPQFYPRLINQALRIPNLYQQLKNLANGTPRLFSAIQTHESQTLAKKYGLKSTDPQFNEKLIRAARNSEDDILTLYYLVVNNPALYDKLLTHEGVTVALLSNSKSPSIVSLLEQSANWKRLYIDERNTIFFRVDAPENKHLINKPLDELIFPDDFSKKLTLGYALCRFATSPDQLRQGLEHLISIDRFDQKAFNLIYNTGFRLNEHDKIYKYFNTQLEYYKDKVDNRVQLGRLRNVAAQIIQRSDRPLKEQRFERA